MLSCYEKREEVRNEYFFFFFFFGFSLLSVYFSLSAILNLVLCGVEL